MMEGLCAGRVYDVIRLPINGLVWSSKGLDRVIAVRSAHERRASR
jgi:hypothetical protein